MRTKEAIKAELDWLKNKATALNERRAHVEQELAEALAEFKVGQRVMQGNGTKAEEYEIEAVFLKYGKSLRYRGRKVTKSGALHKVSQELYGTLKPKEVSE
jgi:hypothetical protein